MEITICTAIKFLENQQNDTFKEIFVVGENKIEEEVSIDKPILRPMSIEDGENLKKIKISVQVDEHGTYKTFLKHNIIFQLGQK
jgi:hypothetical protein